MCITNNNVKICVKHNCEYTKRATSNKYTCLKCVYEYNKLRNSSVEQRAKKRGYDKINKTKKRLENPIALQQAQEKYKQTDKYRDRKILRLSITLSNIYCLTCKDARVYGSNYCNNCDKILYIIEKHNFLSICKHCNKEYGVDIKVTNYKKVFQLNKYCSVECSEQLNNITKKKNAKIHRCKYKRIKEDKQLAKKYGNKYEPVNRTIVFRKYNYICTSCGIKCIHPKADNYNQPNAATLDHVIPKSKGGGHTYDNVTLLCRSCNTIKSDSLPTQLKRNKSQLELQFIDYIPQGTQLQLQMT